MTLKPVPRKTVEQSEQAEQDLIALQRGKLGKMKKRNVPEPKVIKILLSKPISIIFTNKVIFSVFKLSFFFLLNLV